MLKPRFSPLLHLRFALLGEYKWLGGVRADATRLA